MAVFALLVAFANVPLIEEPVPLNPPVKPDPDGANHAYVVPEGTMPLVRLVGKVLKLAPLQITAVNALITAFGLILMVTVKLLPVQLPAVGVTA